VWSITQNPQLNQTLKIWNIPEAEPPKHRDPAPGLSLSVGRLHREHSARPLSHAGHVCTGEEGQRCSQHAGVVGRTSICSTLSHATWLPPGAARGHMGTHENLGCVSLSAFVLGFKNRIVGFFFLSVSLNCCLSFLRWHIDSTVSRHVEPLLARLRCPGHHYHHASMFTVIPSAPKNKG
jgi:hypothetical protein